MNKLIEKPHQIFSLMIPMIMLVGILSGDAFIDINVHDTYFVITYLFLAILISIVFGIIGLGYWIMQKANIRLSKWLNLIHVVLTIGGLITIFAIPYLLFDSKAQSAFPLFDQNVQQNLMLTWTTFLIILGQLMYLINLTLGIFRKNKTSGYNNASYEKP